MLTTLFYSGGSPAVEEAASLSRDDRVLLAIRDALAATNRFSDVVVATDRDDFSAETSTPPFVAIWQTADAGDDNDEVWESNSDGTYVIRHEMHFEVAVVTRDATQAKRNHDVKRLVAVVRNALRDNDLGGLVDGHWTSLGPGRLQTLKVSNVDSPDARFDFMGKCYYFVNSDAGYDESDDYAPAGYDPDAPDPPSDGPVKGAGGLLFSVAKGTYVLTDATTVEFQGGVGVTADNAIRDVWLDQSGAIQVGASFPGVTPHAPLATVTAAGGEITDVEDVSL